MWCSGWSARGWRPLTSWWTAFFSGPKRQTVASRRKKSWPVVRMSRLAAFNKTVTKKTGATFPSMRGSHYQHSELPLKEIYMKKLLTLVFATLLGASLSFAQAAGGNAPPAGNDTTKTGTTKTKGHHHGKKGGKKGKKSSGGTTTQPPK